MADLVQTNLPLHPDHRALLEQVAADNEWSMRETVVRGVRLLGELMKVYEEWAIELEADDKGEYAHLLRRVTRDLGLELLVNRREGRGIEFGVNDADGSPALRIGELAFAEAPGGELIAIRDRGESVEVSAVKDGHLTVIGVYPRPGSPTLN